MPTIAIDIRQTCRQLEDALAKANGLESDIHAIVEAIAALSVGRRGDIKSLCDFTALSHPELWRRFNGNTDYPSSTLEYP